MPKIKDLYTNPCKNIQSWLEKSKVYSFKYTWDWLSMEQNVMLRFFHYKKTDTEICRQIQRQPPTTRIW